MTKKRHAPSKPFRQSSKKRLSERVSKNEKKGMRLNQFIAHAGISSRREADELIKAGLVKVNGTIILEMGYRVKDNDTVKFNNETIRSETKRYVLLNKPKDFLTSTNDPRKKHVYSLIETACKERVYPIGRLDKLTSGLLLFTNDGEMVKRLTNPKKPIKKIYHITLDKNLKSNDMKAISEGIILDGYKVQVDTISYVQNAPKKEVGIELSFGRNNTLKNVFQQLGYKVTKQDLVFFGGLTKKDIPRGKYRLLSQKEVAMLKMI